MENKPATLHEKRLESPFVQWYHTSAPATDKAASWTKYDRGTCLKIEYFFNEFMNSSCTSDHIFQLSKSQIFSLKHMFMFSAPNNLENVKEDI